MSSRKEQKQADICTRQRPCMSAYTLPKVMTSLRARVRHYLPYVLTTCIFPTEVPVRMVRQAQWGNRVRLGPKVHLEDILVDQNAVGCLFISRRRGNVLAIITKLKKNEKEV